MGKGHDQETYRISQIADKQMTKTIFNQTSRIYTLLSYQVVHQINKEFKKYSVLVCIQTNRL